MNHPELLPGISDAARCAYQIKVRLLEGPVADAVQTIEARDAVFMTEPAMTLLPKFDQREFENKQLRAEVRNLKVQLATHEEVAELRRKYEASLPMPITAGRAALKQADEVIDKHMDLILADYQDAKTKLEVAEQHIKSLQADLKALSERNYKFSVPVETPPEESRSPPYIDRGRNEFEADRCTKCHRTVPIDANECLYCDVPREGQQ